MEFTLDTQLQLNSFFSKFEKGTDQMYGPSNLKTVAIESAQTEPKTYYESVAQLQENLKQLIESRQQASQKNKEAIQALFDKQRQEEQVQETAAKNQDAPSYVEIQRQNPDPYQIKKETTPQLDPQKFIAPQPSDSDFIERGSEKRDAYEKIQKAYAANPPKFDNTLAFNADS